MTDFPGCLWPVPEGPWCRPNLPGDSSSGPRSQGLPAVLGDLGICQMSHGVDQLSRGTQAPVRGPAVSNTFPGRLALGSENSRGRPALPDDTASCQKSHECDLRSWVTRARALWPRGQPDVPGESGLCRRAHGNDQMSRATLARVRRPSGSTSCPGQLGPGSDRPRGQAALPGDSRFGLRARGVEQLSQATRALPGCSLLPSLKHLT